jgi:hypothetical protein
MKVAAPQKPMTPFGRLSPDQITNYDPIQLGTGGFCFLVAELLKAKYPQAELCRLTNREGTTYHHVFVRVDGRACDIKGFRCVHQMRFDLNDDSLVEEIADAQAIQDYFYHRYTDEQLAAARVSLTPLCTQIGGCFSGAPAQSQQPVAGSPPVKPKLYDNRGLPAD